MTMLHEPERHASLAEDAWDERIVRQAIRTIVEVALAHHGMGRFSLWTGDLGVALQAWSCLDGTAEFPTLDAA